MTDVSEKVDVILNMLDAAITDESGAVKEYGELFSKLTEIGDPTMLVDAGAVSTIREDERRHRLMLSTIRAKVQAMKMSGALLSFPPSLPMLR